MDRKNRPVSRQKNVTGEIGHVGKKGTGLRGGAGGIGGPGHYGRHGHNGRSGGGDGERGYSGGTGGSGLLKLAIVLLVILLGGGSGAGAILTDFFGNSGYETQGTQQATTATTSNTTGDYYVPHNSNIPNLVTGQGNSSNGSGTLNTTVAPEAREKYTRFVGKGNDKVTLMVYMCGTDLESRSGMATSDMQEMLNAGVGQNVNLLVYTGGCNGWKNNVISSRTNQIYQVTDKGLNCLEKDLGKRAMTDPDTLSWFIRYGAKNYPADRYQLIFWDHGGGSISGFGYDETNSRAGSMTIDKIGKALSDGGVKFDFVGFDACLMATLETALAVEPYADYMIASEETEPGVGWYYTNWLSRLTSDSSLPTVELGKQIIDDFVSVCGQRVPSSQTTLSIVDLAELIGTVPDKFKAFSENTTEMIKNDQYQVVSGARGRTKEFGKQQKIDQIDLIHLTEQLGTPEAESLSNALRNAVKYNRTSSNVSHANGISIYFPYGRTNSVRRMTNMYEEIGLDDSYAKCIQSFASVETSGQAATGGQSGQLDSLFGSLTSNGGSYASPSVLSGTEMAQLLAQMLSRSMPDNDALHGNASNGNSSDDNALEDNASEDTSLGNDFLDAETLQACEQYLTKNQFNRKALKWTQKGDVPVLTLEEDQWNLVQNVELNVFVDDGEGYIDLGLDNVFEFDEDGDLIGTYDHTWMAINHQFVAYYMLSTEGNQEDYDIRGYVPALLNGERVNLMLQFTDEIPNGVVTGAAICYDQETQTQTQAKGEIAVKDGDVLQFVCNYYDYDRNFIDSFMLGDSITVNGELSISNMIMDNENYIATYRLTDIYHNYFWTPSIP